MRNARRRSKKQRGVMRSVDFQWKGSVARRKGSREKQMTPGVVRRSGGDGKWNKSRSEGKKSV
jgi:hypothetical protein